MGQFASGVPGFAGFELGNGDLGWIELTWTSQKGNGIPDTLTVGNWAVNTDPGGSILAGDTGASASPVPEPVTLPLALLAMGAVGIGAWRKRRNRAENLDSCRGISQ